MNNRAKLYLLVLFAWFVVRRQGPERFADLGRLHVAPITKLTVVVVEPPMFRVPKVRAPALLLVRLTPSVPLVTLVLPNPIVPEQELALCLLP